ncbi:Odorant receptor 309 [Nylanderia fulva]|uniref:Odorant receptor n=1 Tax=Nylanderia fulva TaxID=613905 RepID=A0A6G1LPU7_9HYME|nr:Odorant receptor 309 [Nylanderia fulva]
MAKITPEKALKYAKILTYVNFTVPLKNPTRFKMIRLYFLRILVSAHVFIAEAPLVYTILTDDFSDPIKTTKVFSVAIACIQAPWQLGFLSLHYDRLQMSIFNFNCCSYRTITVYFIYFNRNIELNFRDFVISEMEHYFKCAEKYEREVYQFYVDKCRIFYICSVVSVFCTIVGLGFGPIVTRDPIPVDAKYPFNVTQEPMRTVIHVHQSVCLYQCFSSVCHSFLFGILIWFTTARFEIVSNQLRNANSLYDIIAGIREHIKLLRYAEEIITAIRTSILIVIIIVTFSIVTGGLVIVSNAALVDKAQFVILCIAGLFEVYAYAWPADYLMDASTSVADAIYESEWFNQEHAFKTNVLYILFRSQTPLTIQVSSMIPVLSLNYFSSYTSTAFSYLMTLRVIFIED